MCNIYNALYALVGYSANQRVLSNCLKVFATTVHAVRRSGSSKQPVSPDLRQKKPDDHMWRDCVAL